MTKAPLCKCHISYVDIVDCHPEDIVNRGGAKINNAFRGVIIFYVTL